MDRTGRRIAGMVRVALTTLPRDEDAADGCQGSAGEVEINQSKGGRYEDKDASHDTEEMGPLGGWRDRGPVPGRGPRRLHDHVANGR